jgi:hypothetical protein
MSDNLKKKSLHGWEDSIGQTSQIEARQFMYFKDCACYTLLMTHRNKPLPDLLVLALWLFVGYLLYRADPAGLQALKAFVEGVGQFLRSVLTGAI